MRTLLLLTIILSLTACGRRAQPMDVDTTDAGSIPRSVALKEIQKLLPKAYMVVCNDPGTKVFQKHIEKWSWDSLGASFKLVAAFKRPDPVQHLYDDVSKVDLLRSGKLFVVQTYSEKKEGKIHFQYWFTVEEEAKQVVELFEALRQKT